MVSVRFSTVFTRSQNGEISLAAITGDETCHIFFVEIRNKDSTKYDANYIRLDLAV